MTILLIVLAVGVGLLGFALVIALMAQARLPASARISRQARASDGSDAATMVVLGTTVFMAPSADAGSCGAGGGGGDGGSC